MRIVEAFALCSLATIAMGCATPAPPVAAIAVPSAIPQPRNADFETPGSPVDCAPSWACSMHNDPLSYRYEVVASTHGLGGSRMHCMQRLSREPWARFHQLVQIPDALRGTRVRLSFLMRAEGRDGAAAGPLVIMYSPQVHETARAQELVAGEVEWRRVHLDFLVADWTGAIDAGLLMMGGGRVCIDDVRLEPSPKDSKP